jgi:predicted SnoaL-like aldol condensation-catalyzing enzyme
MRSAIIREAEERALTMATMIDLFRQIVDRGFNDGDLSVADEICADTLIEHEYLAPNARGADILKGQITDARSGVDGLQLSIEDYVETGDKVWVRMRARGKEVRSGKSVDFCVFDVCRFKDGRLVEHWGVPDRFALLHQAGALPVPW